MSRFASLAVISVASLGITLATPEVSQAQFGIHLDVGRSHFEYSRGPGYGHHGHYPGYRYDSFRGYGSHHGHHDHYYHGRRRPIVIPEYHHWTPDRGFHSHGQILVPLDTSERAEAVLPVARALAKVFDASLQLVHVTRARDPAEEKAYLDAVAASRGEGGDERVDEPRPPPDDARDHERHGRDGREHRGGESGARALTGQAVSAHGVSIGLS